MCRLILLTLTGSSLVGHSAAQVAPSLSTPVPFDGQSPWDMATGDFNGDGVDDLVFSFLSAVWGVNSTELQVGFGSSAGEPVFGVILATTGGESRGVESGDLDGDGNPDIVVSTDAGICVFLGLGGASFAPPQGYVTGWEDQVALAGMNEDGNVDTLGDDAILLGDGTGAFPMTTPVSWPGIGFNGFRMLVGDWNGDGHTDSVSWTSQSLSFNLGDGSGGLVSSQTASAGGGTYWWPGAVADLNLDGVPDVVIPNGSERGRMFLGNGDGTFLTSSPVIGGGIASVEGVVSGDWNADGRSDLIYAGPDSTADDWAASVLNLTVAGSWTFLGQGFAGPSDLPLLTGQGTLNAGTTLTLDLQNAVPGLSPGLVVDAMRIDVPIPTGDVLVPSPDLILYTLPPASSTGGWSLSAIWPAGIPAGTEYFHQMWSAAPGSPVGYLASNGLLPGSAGLLALSAPVTSSTPLGSGCELYLDVPGAQVALTFTAAGSQWQLPVPIPNDPTLSGLRIDIQFAVASGTSPIGAYLANGVHLNLEN